MRLPSFTSASQALFLGVALAPFSNANESCPFMKAYESNKQRRVSFRLLGEGGDGGKIPQGGFAAVKEDIKQVLVDSKDVWPADYGNYGPFMIRLAWHCSGSYRRSDGRGGCDGGRIRFDPELNWPDNGNLDEALSLLEPIKSTYGSDLSWGDLIILTGTTAIESMGFPEMGFCGGRVDDDDGSFSVALGPTEEQRVLTPCEINGECEFPLGPTTIGLIYVNPAGPQGNPDQAASAVDVRNSFGNMGFNDSETVSLIGGGHAFGKCHGACESPPCGEGTGPDGNPLTVTSGFEGQWSTTPTTWSNEYFNNLINFDFNLTSSPAGEPQWVPINSDGTPGPANLIMLTADLALTQDEDYAQLVSKYAEDLSALETDFAASWYRLTSQDMGPASRCIGEFVLDPQPFQQPLPSAPMTKLDFKPVEADITAMLQDGTFAVDDLVRLAYQCASTYRATDYSGGCNGARIRFPPESDWEVNAGLDDVLTKLATVDGGDVSVADTIVLAGNAALKMAGIEGLTFCGGRTDASDASFSENLAPRDYLIPATVAVRDNFVVMGLTAEQGVALYGRPTSRYPELGSLFAALVDTTFEGPDASGMYTPMDGGNPITAQENALKQDIDLMAIVDEFNGNMASFKMEFASAWTYLMTADRFDGPTGNLCTDVDDLASAPMDAPTTTPAAGDVPSAAPSVTADHPTTSPTSSAVKARGAFMAILLALMVF